MSPYGSHHLYTLVCVFVIGEEPEELFEAISQAILNAVDRDALSGWGAVVHVITVDGCISRTLRGRMD